MEIKITGYVEVTLKDKDGNIVAQDCGYNDVTEMSNNILMDAIHPRLGSTGSATDVDGRTTATAQTAEPRGMTANDNDITGAKQVLLKIVTENGVVSTINKRIGLLI